ncbi:urea ABC transporter [Rhizobium sp. Root1204]|uniref:ABC transporter permease subunit n=1 Tax=Rhizobium sp. Root1204 TaxID=1736428 RepID=UPI00071331B9|nr:urea ABC transporter [Rhizobium sp. Root1204]KQV41330.1 urea ABC transporter [Rhizobium sp. Root1204]
MNAKNLEFLSAISIGITLLVVMPNVTDLFGLMQITGFMAIAVFALSQGFVWGFAGIMSFGQAAFMGLGGYAYAVAAINFGDSTPAIFFAVLIPSVFAGLLGYFMFYGKISDAYVGVITMTAGIILFNVINSTSGDAYRIGAAALGGFNGIPSIPTLNAIGDPTTVLDPEQLWYVTMGTVIAVYALLRGVLTTRFGQVVVAIRENETRVNLLGYDSRFYKLLAFVLSAAIAGLAGCLFANWSAFISPTIFAMAMSAQAIIFVLVGGLGTLIGPIVGALIIQWLVSAAGSQSTFDANLLLGGVLVIFVLAIPKGIIPLARDLAVRFMENKPPVSEPIQTPAFDAEKAR